jgi:subtilisin family serine protease
MDRASSRHHGRFPAAWPAATLAAILLAVFMLPAAGRAEEPTPPTESAPAVPGQLIVGFDEGSSPSLQRKTVTKAGAKIEERLSSIDAAVIVSRRNTTTEEVADELSSVRTVDYVEPNYILTRGRLPNDVGLARLWGLRNVGQLDGTPDADINAAGAWDVTTGGDVPVAVLDTGVDYRHPDLDGNLWTNPDEIPGNSEDDDENGYEDDVHGFNYVAGDPDPDDDAGHGTHVAGIIGAEGDNLIGTVGVNWRVQMMVLKFLDANGEGSTSDAAQAIDYAVDEGARVINASWGGPAFSHSLSNAIKRAGERGVLFVAAAGNEGEDSDSKPQYPAAFDLPNVISVGASDANDRLLDFSNYGRRTVDLAAPGDEIYSTVPAAVSAPGYATYSGTSMAAPFVSGAAALYLARSPGSSSQEVRDALLSTVDPVAALAAKTVTGGRLNVGRALGSRRGAVPSPAAPGSEVGGGGSEQRDVTRPSPFRLIRPRDRYRARRKGISFVWERSRDQGGIRQYKLFLNGKARRTVRDPDGPGGRSPSRKIRVRR